MKKVLQGVVPVALLVASSAMANNLFGIDVSSYQGSINWATVHSNGAEFAFARATQGITFQDSYFKSNMTNGKNAGMQMGGYDIGEMNTDTPAQDAAYFWNFASSTIKADGKTISPVLDPEGTGHFGTSSYSAWITDWVNDIITDASAAGLVVKPIVYVGGCGSGLSQPLWIANYNGENLYTGNPGCSPWEFWQVSSTGRIGGISGNVDFDAFNGSLSQLISIYGVKAKP